MTETMYRGKGQQYYETEESPDPKVPVFRGKDASETRTYIRRAHAFALSFDQRSQGQIGPRLYLNLRGEAARRFSDVEPEIFVHDIEDLDHKGEPVSVVATTKGKGKGEDAELEALDDNKTNRGWRRFLRMIAAIFALH